MGFPMHGPAPAGFVGDRSLTLIVARVRRAAGQREAFEKLAREPSMPSHPPRPRPSKQTGPHPLDTGLPSSPIGTVSKGQIDDPG